MLASRSGTLLNTAEVARGIGMPQTTIKRYMAVLHAAFLVQLVPAWTAGTGRRLIRTPKSWFTDTGLAAGVLSLSAQRLATAAMGGAFLESFVVAELTRQATAIDEARKAHADGHTKLSVRLDADTAGQAQAKFGKAMKKKA